MAETTETETGATDSAQQDASQGLNIEDYVGDDMADATQAVEQLLLKRKENQRIHAPKNEADGYLDEDARNLIESTILANLQRYGREYYDGTHIIKTGKDENAAFFNFDENGNIFEIEQDENGSPKQGENGLPVRKGPSAVGNIKDGLDIGPGNFKRPHEATVILLQSLTREFDSLPENAQGRASEEAEELQKTEQELNDAITAFFAGMDGGLEDEYRSALTRNQGLDTDAFKNSELGKQIKEKKPDGFDDFITLTFMLERDRVGTDPQALGDFSMNADEISAIQNLLGIMRTDSYNPEEIYALRQDALEDDRILSASGYDFMNGVDGGERVPLERLYYDSDTDRKAVIEGAFPGRTDATREEIYDFVRQQIEIRAIEELSDARLKDYDGTAKDFIEAHEDTLQGVSQAMLEGRFNPHPDDLEILFKSFDRPDFNDPSLLREIQRRHSSGDMPNAAYAQNNFNEEELAVLTGDKNFAQRTSAQQREALDAILKNENIEAQFNALGGHGSQRAELYERLMINFHEPYMANFTWWRNGPADGSDPDTWNGRYGTPNDTQNMHIAVRNNWNHLEDAFGTHAAEIKKATFTNGVIDLTTTYDDVMAQLSPGAQAALQDEMKRIPNTSAYTYAVSKFDSRDPNFRRQDLYVELRAEYLNSRADEKLSAQFKKGAEAETAAPVVTGNPGVDPGANPGAGGGDANADGAAGPQAYSSSQKDFKLNEDNDKNTDIPYSAAYARYVGEDLTRAKNFGKNMIERIRSVAADANVKPAHLRRIENLLNTSTHPEATLAQRSMAFNKAHRLAEQYGINISDIARDAEKAAKRPIVPETSGSTKRTPKPASSTTQSATRGFAEAADTIPEGHRIMLKPKTELAVRVEPGRLSSIMDMLKNNAFPKIQMGLGQALKGLQSTFKYAARVAPLIGYFVAKSDEAHAREDVAPALMSAGLLDEEAFTDLGSKYDWHVTQSTVDISGVAGELKTTNDFYDYMQEHELDWATTLMLRPPMLSKDVADFFDKHTGGLRVPDLELFKLYETYGDENLTKLYKNITDKFGLPETITIEGIDTPVPIGIAIRDPEIAEQLQAAYSLSEYPAQREGLKALEIINQTASIAREWTEREAELGGGENKRRLEAYTAAKAAGLIDDIPADLQAAENANEITGQDNRAEEPAATPTPAPTTEEPIVRV